MMQWDQNDDSLPIPDTYGLWKENLKDLSVPSEQNDLRIKHLLWFLPYPIKIPSDEGHHHF